mmetsp:Transcript_31265/g.52752  ORF Transcript_31265/g.52752 Transcript_31265/m.52752 type:complete len:433 (+) Transcript_31265:115-1413(+)
MDTNGAHIRGDPENSVPEALLELTPPAVQTLTPVRVKTPLLNSRTESKLKVFPQEKIPENLLKRGSTISTSNRQLIVENDTIPEPTRRKSAKLILLDNEAENVKANRDISSMKSTSKEIKPLNLKRSEKLGSFLKSSSKKQGIPIMPPMIVSSQRTSAKITVVPLILSADKNESSAGVVLANEGSRNTGSHKNANEEDGNDWDMESLLLGTSQKITLKSIDNGRSKKTASSSKNLNSRSSTRGRGGGGGGWGQWGDDDAASVDVSLMSDDDDGSLSPGTLRRNVSRLAPLPKVSVKSNKSNRSLRRSYSTGSSNSSDNDTADDDTDVEEGSKAQSSQVSLKSNDSSKKKTFNQRSSKEFFNPDNNEKAMVSYSIAVENYSRTTSVTGYQMPDKEQIRDHTLGHHSIVDGYGINHLTGRKFKASRRHSYKLVR